MDVELCICRDAYVFKCLISDNDDDLPRLNDVLLKLNTSKYIMYSNGRDCNAQACVNTTII